MAIEIKKASLASGPVARHYACTSCGSVYQSFLSCVCPSCHSGVVRQRPLTPEEAHERVSYTHFKKPIERSASPFSNIPDINAQEEYQQSQVIIDALSFSFKIKDLQHCSKSGKYSGFRFPEAPSMSEMNNFVARTENEADELAEFRKRLVTNYLEEVLRVFIKRVLGFSFGPLRGKGFQFYEDSFALFDDSGNDYCGQVGIGGNNETVHFQISGTGCKHLFTNRSRAFVHHWLADVLGISLLARCDLAFDDFDNLHTCEASERAYYLGGFNRNHGKCPKFKNGDEFSINSDGEKVFTMEARFIGSRQSLVYWRIYNKKLEQKITKDGFTWYRSEVELKKVSVDILLDIEGHFVGLNEYAASLPSKTIEPNLIKLTAKKRVACDVLHACFWAKRQYGRLVNSLLTLYKNDFEKVVTSLIRDDTNIGFTSMHQKLINELG
ncbi:replication initiation factor domain-containing protein [Vibrio metschnikovii]|uniref:replication initiation factor domain-containing protein n=1 Tax=Vibrio metschnikovii TaxID=28172 RepID=UPI00315C89B3